MARHLVGGRFPSDVRLVDGALVDLALAQRYPLSSSAWTYLRLIEAGWSVEQIIAGVSERGGLAADVVRRHCGELIAALNEAMLLNLDVRGVRGRFLWAWFSIWSRAIARRAPTARLQRFALGGPVSTTVRDVTRGVLLGMAPWWIALACLCLVVAYRSPAWELIAAVSLALPVAIAIHETAHAIAVQRHGGGRFLAVRGLSVSVIHSRAHSGVAVHAVAPLLTGLCGGALVAAAMVADSAPLAMASTPFIGQLLTLTALAADGRLLVRHLSGPVE